MEELLASVLPILAHLRVKFFPHEITDPLWKFLSWKHPNRFLIHLKILSCLGVQLKEGSRCKSAWWLSQWVLLLGILVPKNHRLAGFLIASICICCKKETWISAGSIAWIVEVNFPSNAVKTINVKVFSFAFWDIWTISSTFLWGRNSFISIKSPNLETLFAGLELGWMFWNLWQILIESEQK